jgi:hypothetical protein
MAEIRTVIHATTHGHWAGIDIPGLQPPSPAIEHGNQLTKAAIRHVLHEGYVLKEGWQPYIKLHGSYNWRTETGHLLIIGGAKSIDIAKVPLLTWYHEQFRKLITMPDVRLMIVGYSFRDKHINEHLEAAARVGAKLFIVDPEGSDVIDKRDKRAQITSLRNPYLTICATALWGRHDGRLGALSTMTRSNSKNSLTF